MCSEARKSLHEYTKCLMGVRGNVNLDSSTPSIDKLLTPQLLHQIKNLVQAVETGNTKPSQ